MQNNQPINTAHFNELLYSSSHPILSKIDVGVLHRTLLHVIVHWEPSCASLALYGNNESNYNNESNFTSVDPARKQLNSHLPLPRLRRHAKSNQLTLQSKNVLTTKCLVSGLVLSTSSGIVVIFHLRAVYPILCFLCSNLFEQKSHPNNERWTDNEWIEHWCTTRSVIIWGTLCQFVFIVPVSVPPRDMASASKVLLVRI